MAGKYNPFFSGFRREGVVATLSKISGLPEKDIKDMIIRAYPQVCRIIYECTGAEKITEDHIAFLAEEVTWEKIVAEYATKVTGRPAVEFPFPFMPHAITWEEGIPHSREYAAYRHGQETAKQMEGGKVDNSPGSDSAGRDTDGEDLDKIRAMVMELELEEMQDDDPIAELIAELIGS